MGMDSEESRSGEMSKVLEAFGEGDEVIQTLLIVLSVGTGTMVVLVLAFGLEKLDEWIEGDSEWRR